MSSSSWPNQQVPVPDEKCYCGAELRRDDPRWRMGQEGMRNPDSSLDKKKKGWYLFIQSARMLSSANLTSLNLGWHERFKLNLFYIAGLSLPSHHWLKFRYGCMVFLLFIFLRKKLLLFWYT